MKFIHKSVLDPFGSFFILYFLFQMAFWRVIRGPEPEECLFRSPRARANR